jgi:hypothetical protein
LLGVEGKPKMTLHRLSGEDPEAIDYAKDEPETVARLKALYDEWIKEVTPK